MPIGSSRGRCRRQFETKFSVGSYLAYQGDKFVERFDANSYLTLSMAIDLFDLGDTPRATGRVAAPVECRWLLVSFTSDWLFPAVPVAGDGRCPDRRGQAGQLLQRARATAATTPSCCRTICRSTAR